MPFYWIWKKNLAKFIPQRVITAIMGFLAIVVSYAMRTCLSVAITEMVIPVIDRISENKSLVCEALYLPMNHTNDNGISTNAVSQNHLQSHSLSGKYYCPR